MIKITEFQLNSINKNVNKELIIKLRIKPEDYTPELEDALYEKASNKTCFAGVFQEFGVEEVDNSIGKKRSLLVIKMKKYCELSDINEEQETQKLYDKYGIQSRTELPEEALDKEIKTYDAGIQEYYLTN